MSLCIFKDCDLPIVPGLDNCAVHEAWVEEQEDPHKIVTIRHPRSRRLLLRHLQGRVVAMMTCDHSLNAQCWLCSDAQPWWREARIKAAKGSKPPNKERMDMLIKAGHGAEPPNRERMRIMRVAAEMVDEEKMG